MNARQELAKVIRNSEQLGCGCCADRREISTGPEEWDTDYVERDYALADDILEAGYSKPRTVTFEEAESLADAAVILTPGLIVFRKYDNWFGDGKVAWVRCTWGDNQPLRTSSLSWDMHFPAIVLHEGGAA